MKTFKSKFTLSFQNSNVERQYNTKLEPKIMKFNRIVSFILFLISLICVFLIYLKMKQKENLNLRKFIISIVFVTNLNFIVLVLSMILNHKKIHIFTKCYLFISITFVIVFYRYYARIIIADGTILYTTLMYTEFLLRILFVIVGIFSFYEILIMNIMITLAFAGSNLFIFGMGYGLDYFAFYTLQGLDMLISYYYIRHNRLSFFYNKRLKENNTWYDDVLNKMNNGFLCIQNKNFKFVNKTLIDLIMMNLNSEIERSDEIEGDHHINFTEWDENKKRSLESNYSKLENNNVIDSSLKRNPYKIIKVDTNSNNNCKSKSFELIPEIFMKKKEKIIEFLFRGDNEITLKRKDRKTNDEDKLEHSIKKDKNFELDIFNTQGFLRAIKDKYRKVNKESSKSDKLNDRIRTSVYSDKNLSNPNDFHYLFTKKLEFKKDDEIEEKFFEISFRYYNNNSDDNLEELNDNDIFEFILNDVTRTKFIEEKNAEFKYKTLFLSKIAHEFKNPLICITELVDQACDKYSSQMSEESNFKLETLSTKLQSIKSLSDYLLILIKDLDYFSQTQLDNRIEIIPAEISLTEILTFIRNLGISLLMKNGKSDYINIVVEKNSEVPDKIFTDEIKLKQILINLLSNAIKFTIKGFIRLTLSLEKDEVKFLVADTGPGMSKQQIQNIFKPYKKGKDSTNINTYGSGLGLYIVHEIAKNLGTKIEFESKEGEGTKFWFYLPLPVSEFIDIEKIEKNNMTNEPIIAINMIHDNLDRFSHNINESNLIPEETIYILSDIENIISRLYLNHNDEFSNFNVDGNELDCVLNKFQDSSNKKEYSSNNNDSNLSSMIKTKIINKINFNKADLLNVKNPKNKQSLFKKQNSKDSKENKMIEINLENDCIENMKKKTDHSKSINVNLNINSNNIVMKTKNSPFSLLNNVQFEKEGKNVILIDDEKLARQSALRILNKISLQKQIKINIIEAEDGIECIYTFYKLIREGVKISGIISDQTMNYMEGSKAAQIIGEIQENKRITRIPYFIVTAYEDKETLDSLKNRYVKEIFSKPFTNVTAERILNYFLTE